MIRVQLTDGAKHEFPDDAVAEWDVVLLQVVWGLERWSFPLSSVAFFVTDGPTP